VIVLGRRKGPVIVGHRGGRGEGWPPENTLAAFERAHREGAHAVETDVRLCADEVVLFHDPTLARMTEKRDSRAVAGVPWADLARVGLGSQGEKIPRLVDVLSWAEQSGTAVNVEVKHDVPDRLALVRAVVRLLGGSRVPLLVSSFDPFVLAVMRVLAPALPCALLTDPGQAYAAVLHRVARPGLVFGLHVERRQADPKLIAGWKRRGLAVGVWTVNDPEEARRLEGDGVDVLITDQPGRLVEALRCSSLRA
jgi:glycerophosphoryl diester phosphodiesterase